jgi:serine O-acetyltransferase
VQYDPQTVKQWAGDSQWRAWRADLARFRVHGHNGFGSEGFWALTLYRMQRHALNASPRVLWIPVKFVLALMKKCLTAVLHINLDRRASIGPGMYIPHVGPIRVHPQAVIGADCAIHHVCTIGAGSSPGAPTIGDHVMMGAHSCVLGPVTVGDGAIIGAGAVVVCDIPAGATAMGVPAKVYFHEK